MKHYLEITQLIALSMGVAWASGINLYAALLVLGLGGASGNIALPEPLLVLQDPMVITAAGLMYFVEFFADKIPGIDTGWDTIHTFIRIPAGAMLAAGAVGDVTPALQITAGVLGGTVAGATHTAKAGTRLVANTSPEPLTNWGLSLAEDAAVFGGLWLALQHPALFLVLFCLFIVLMVWLLPRLLRLARALLQRIAGFFRQSTAGSSSRVPLRLRLPPKAWDEGPRA